MTNSITDFQRESYRIDEQIWDAMALRSGERVLFLGLPNEGAWLVRAVEIGVRAEALSADDAQLEQIEKLGGAPIRGSATMVPAVEHAFDAAVAMHYLHEIDPGFHSQVIAEMARVAKRVVLIEPSPPADPLGRRIASLYSRARREEGQFETYQTLEYWRKMLAIVKGDVWQSLLTFTRVPPKHAVSLTVDLVLDAMAIEDMPETYLDELRELAARPDAQLLPLSRIVLVGTGAGETPPHGAVEPFRPGVELAPPAAFEPPAIPAEKKPALPTKKPAVPVPVAKFTSPVGPYKPPAPSGTPPDSFGFAPEDEDAADQAFAPQAPAKPAAAAKTPAPPKPAPKKPAAPPAAKQPKPTPKVVPEAPPVAPGQAPFGAPFALGGEDDEEIPFGGTAEPPKDGFGWSWEPPEPEEPAKP